MNVKHIGLATFAAALLLSATAFAADPHHGGGAPHGGGAAPHGGGGGAPHVGGGGMPHDGGGGFAHGGGGFSHGGGMASFSHAAPSFNRAAGESHGSFASFGHGAEVHRNTATIHSFDRARGLEAPRGSTAATYTHAHGAYGGMEHAGAAATGGGPQHYAHDPRGFGSRPSNWNNRPRNFDRGSYQRNASATRALPLRLVQRARRLPLSALDLRRISAVGVLGARLLADVLVDVRPRHSALRL